MIQRIQSVFLLLAAICLTLTLFFPLAEVVAQTEKITLSAFNLTHLKINASGNEEVVKEEQIIYVAGIIIVAIIVIFYSIFQYKNRMKQIMLGALNSLLIGAALGLTLYLLFQISDEVKSGTRNFLLAFYLFPVALIFNSVANRFIRKDEKLVRDADRIR